MNNKEILWYNIQIRQFFITQMFKVEKLPP